MRISTALMLSVMLAACPLAMAQAVVAQPRAVKTVPARIVETEKGTYLGIASSSAPASLREQLKLKPGIGLVVEQIEKSSPAEEAGIKRYDVLEKFNDQWLVSPEQLAVLIRMQSPGADVKLSIIRQGQPQTLTAKLIESEVPPLQVDAPGNTAGWGQVMFKGFSGGDTSGRRGPVVIDGNGPMKVTSTIGNLTFSLTHDNRGTVLFATDMAGNVLFNGNIDTKEQWNSIPADIAVKVKDLLVKMKLPNPATKPAE